MSRTLKTVGVIAGALALAATGVGAIAGAGLVIAGGVTVGAVATAAGLTATAATAAAQITSKAPPVRGALTQLLIAPDVPQPYMIGEGFYGGVLRHDASYGATLNDVPNPYRALAVVYSGGGPIESITPYVDKAAVTGYYSGYLYTDTQLGDTPEADALSPHFAGAPGWDASSKLSGQAAILWNLLFDKKGKRFASGVPQIGAYGQWAKAYDPRLDSTFPGGVGAHRLDDETTWEWTENPALHFGTYAYGRHQNGVRTIGCGLTSIDWGVVAAWANVCEANGWTIFGVIYEPGNRWDNLKDIASAGGGVPVVSSGGLLSVKYWAPQVSLDTITAADIAEGQVQYSPLQSWDERVNTIVPRFTSADNEWNQVAAEPVSIAGFVTEDGEEKRKEWPYNLVKDAGQAAQLAAYQIYEGREISPIVVPCLPRLRAFRPGECLTLDLPDYGLEMDAIILQRALDPVTLTVTLTLIGETPEKHAAALGQTPAPPAVPVAGQDGEDRDETIHDTGSNPPRVVADEAAMLALVVPEGTVVKRTDNGTTYFYNGGTSGTIADWTEIGITSASGAALTRTNDTNVTVTLGGSPATALLNAASLTLGWSGTLAGDRGGTGIGSYAVGDLVYASGASALSKLAAVATGNALISGGVTTAPAWGKIGLTTHVSGTLPVANGGTGVTSSTGSGSNVLSAGPTLTGTLTAAVGNFSGPLRVNAASPTLELYNAALSTRYGFWFSNGTNSFIGADVGALVFQTGGVTRAQINSTGLDVTGEVRGDSFRLDQTPVSATPTPTHTFTVSLNGTTYRIPCVI